MEERENNKKKIIFIVVAIILAVVLVGVVIIPILSAFLRTEEDFKFTKVSYSISETTDIKKSSFKSLNSVTYPDGSLGNFTVSSDYVTAVNCFSKTIYDEMFKGDIDNMSFSPLGLYNNLSLMAVCSSNSVVQNCLDGLLGLNKDLRKTNFINSYKSNFFANDYGTVQTYNGYFQTNKYTANATMTKELAEYYTEAYSLDFSSDKDVNKMLSWIDDKVQDENFLSKQDLDIKENTLFYLISTMYFNNRWASAFDTANTVKGDFTNNSGEKTQAEYMYHSYFGDVYDYGKYFSVYDYYANGMKIKYIAPFEDESEDIFTLTENENLFLDVAENKYKPKDSSEYYGDDVVIKLKVPKFSSEYFYDFSNLLKKVGLEYLFSPNNKSFNYAFTDLKAEDTVYLDFVKQKNKISFSESGTEIKSVTFASMACGTAAPFNGDTLEITLDRPFIYIIYDRQNLPLYVGCVTSI